MTDYNASAQQTKIKTFIKDFSIIFDTMHKELITDTTGQMFTKEQIFQIAYLYWKLENNAGGLL